VWKLSEEGEWTAYKEPEPTGTMMSGWPSHAAPGADAARMPNAAHEALRDVVCPREAAKQDKLRTPHRQGKYLLRKGKRPPHTMRAWSQNYLELFKLNDGFFQSPNN